MQRPTAVAKRGIRMREQKGRAAKPGQAAFALWAAAWGAMLAIGAISTPLNAQELPSFDIPSGPMSEALAVFAEQADMEILYTDREMHGVVANSVEGHLTLAAALALLIEGTGLEFVQINSVFVVRRIEVASLPPEAPAPERAADAGRAVTQNLAPDDEVIVLGSNIRGAGSAAAPLHVYSRRDIEQSGAFSIQDFARTLPYNLDFSESTGAGFAGPASGVGGAGAGVNLRGLGEDATLTLINGRRVAFGGGGGGFVDISLIPVDAVKRISIVSDGASAIYGADAVAGVVNIEMLDGYDGAKTNFQLGAVTDGGLRQALASQFAGKSWGDAQVFGGYEFLGSTPLDSRRRAISAEAADPTDLLPHRERHSVVFGASASPSDRIELEAFGLYSHSDTQFRLADSTAGAGKENTDSALLFSELAATYMFPGGWAAEVSAVYSRNKTDSRRVSAEIVTFDIASRTRSASLELKADGPLAQIPGGAIRLAAGGQFRAEGFVRSTRIESEEIADISRRSLAGFLEVNFPLVSELNRRDGIEALSLTVASRLERYSDFGAAANPKAGLRYVPLRDVALRATIGSSFQAPGFFDLGRGQSSLPLPGAFFAPPPDNDAPLPNVLVLSGGNPDLRPEKALTWTAGADIRLNAAPGFDASITYYSISLRNRIANQGAALTRILADSEQFGDAVRIDPSLDEVLAYYAWPGFRNPFSIAAGDVQVIADNRLQNIAATTARGADISLRYAAEHGLWEVAASIDAAFMFEFTKRARREADVVSLLNTTFYPADFRFRAGLQAVRGAAGGTIFVNYVDNYRSYETGVEAAVEAWTTVDAGLTYEGGRTSSNPILDGLTFSLQVRNLFNANPPFVDLGYGLGVNFDGVNANALGRFVSFRVSKSW